MANSSDTSVEESRPLATSVTRLRNLCESLQRTQAWQIESTAACRKRASVAAILRVTPSPDSAAVTSEDIPPPGDLDAFFQLPWVQTGNAELLFIRRTTNPRDPWSGQMAFPGGKREKGETDRQAAERETREEVGLDLGSSSFMYIGALDEREVTTRFGQRVILVLCPFVYLQLSPATPSGVLSANEVASLHWCPLDYLISAPRPHAIRVELAPRILPRFITGAPRRSSGGSRTNSPVAKPADTDTAPAAPSQRRSGLVAFLQSLASRLLGAVRFEAIRLPDTEVPLWGLTLTMSLDLLEHTGERIRYGKGWPRFDWSDLDLWQRSFGRMLRVRSGEADRSLSRYYQALMLAIAMTFITRVAAGWLGILAIRALRRSLRTRWAQLEPLLEDM